MSYETKDLSIQDSQPALLIKFAQASSVWRYTTLGKSIAKDSATWLPEAIGVGGFSFKDDFNKDQLAIRLPIVNPVADTFVSGPPEFPTSVKVWRADVAEDDLRIYWMGDVNDHSVSGSVVTLNCDPLSAVQKRNGARRVYQRTCPYQVYRRGCNLDENDFVVTLSLTAFEDTSHREMYISGAKDVVGLLGGELRTLTGSGSKIIEAHYGRDHIIKLMHPIPSLQIGDTVKLFPGCDRSLNTCRTRFNNLGNSGAFPGIASVSLINGSGRIF